MTLYKLLDPLNVKLDFLFSHSVGEIPYEAEILSGGGKIYKEYYKYSERHLPDYISPRKLFDRHPEWEGIYINVQKIDTTYRLLVEAARRKLSYRIIHAHNNDNRKMDFKHKLFRAWFDLTKKSVVTDYLGCAWSAGENMFGKCDLTVIPNAIDFKRFAPNQNVRAQMRKNLRFSDHQIVVGFCGRLSYQKNPEKLIDIFAALHKEISESRLLIIGDGEERGEMEKKVNHYGLSDSVIFAGNVPNVPDWLQAMDCFILPSRFEGFPFVLMEAQAAGLRCYTTLKAVPPEVNITGRITYISRNDTPDEWAEKILLTGWDREDCSEVLMNSDYTFDHMTQKIMAIFDPPRLNIRGRLSENLK